MKKNPTNAELRQWAITDGRYLENQLFDADGKEDACSSCCSGLDDKCRKGTPMVSYRCSYEYDEWETTCVRCVYDETRFWASLTDEEIRAML